jgi:hypothetical protein
MVKENLVSLFITMSTPTNVRIVGRGFQEKINLGDTSGGHIQLGGSSVGGATTASQLQMHTVLGNTS